MPAAGCRGRHDPQVPGTGEEYHRVPHGTFRNHGVSGRSEPDQRGRLTGCRASGRRQGRRDAGRPRVGYRRSAALHPFHVRRRRFGLYHQSDPFGFRCAAYGVRRHAVRLRCETRIAGRTDRRTAHRRNSRRGGSVFRHRRPPTLPAVRSGRTECRVVRRGAPLRPPPLASRLSAL